MQAEFYPIHFWIPNRNQETIRISCFYPVLSFSTRKMYLEAKNSSTFLTCKNSQTVKIFSRLSAKISAEFVRNSLVKNNEKLFWNDWKTSWGRIIQSEKISDWVEIRNQNKQINTISKIISKPLFFFIELEFCLKHESRFISIKLSWYLINY